MKKIRGIVKLIGQENKSIYLVTADKKTTTAYSPSEKSREFVKDSLIGKRVEITAHDDSREFTFIRITSDQTKGKDTDRLVIEPVKQLDDGEIEDIATPPNEVEGLLTTDKVPIVEDIVDEPDNIPINKEESTPEPKDKEPIPDIQKENVNYFTKLSSLAGDVEKKGGLNYISWANAWSEVKKVHPEAQFKIYENGSGMPYFADKTGGMVKVSAKINNIEHIVWLPIMDFKNDSMKTKEYSYQRYDKYKKIYTKIKVQAFTTFDINKSIQRAFTKSLALHGFGLYVYKGEDTIDEENGGKNV